MQREARRLSNVLLERSLANAAATQREHLEGLRSQRASCEGVSYGTGDGATPPRGGPLDALRKMSSRALSSLGRLAEPAEREGMLQPAEGSGAHLEGEVDSFIQGGEGGADTAIVESSMVELDVTDSMRSSGRSPPPAYEHSPPTEAAASRPAGTAGSTPDALARARSHDR